jgi:hypothetical protein
VALDQSKVGKVVAEQMEALEADYGEIGEIVGPHGSHVRVRNSDARPHAILGVLRVAEATVLGGYGPDDGQPGE